MATRKITLRVPVKLWANFSVQTKNLFINRAPFLDHMLTLELPYVSADLGNYVMSPKARRYIGGALAKADAKPVNIEIQEETAMALEKVVTKHGLVRDALLCRIIVFLRGSDALFNYLEMPKAINKFGGGVESLPTSPLKAIEETYSDPMFYIRIHLRDTEPSSGIYNCELPRRWDWAVCMIKDEDVPGTKENTRLRDEEMRLAAEFDILEESLFSTEANENEGSK